MLRSLYINNIAIISHLNVDFRDAMTSLTGETGAGKSIVIDALSLALGCRAEQGLLKYNTDKSEVVAEFDTSKYQSILNWLNDHKLDADENLCILRRNLFHNKPSKSFINDRPVTAQLLKELGDQLVHICGQQEHLSLTSPGHRLEIIDTHAGLNNQLTELEKIYRNLTQINQKITELENTDYAGSDQSNMLIFLIKELEDGNYCAEDYRDLDEKQKRFAHTTDVAHAVNSSIKILINSESTNVLESLNQSINLLTAACKYDNRLENALETLSSSRVLCDEVVNELNSVSGKIEFDPQQLNEVEHRLSSYHHLARKHRCQPMELDSKLTFLKQRLDEIENSGKALKTLKTKKHKFLNQYQELATNISKKRYQSAEILSRAMTQHMQELNLKYAVCKIQCLSDTTRLSSSGQDSIQFMVSTTRGQPPGAIEKIASGGELSRISLAIQLEAVRLSHTPVLIFDEVDAGISGETADLVGRRLKELGKQTQVICITHLPQVASKAQHQLRVSKKIAGKSTVELVYLDTNDRIIELARILSGKKITQESLANAKVMLRDSA